ncbi:Hypothetical_protein [Hexamita inflata]|uniref:Hypothetical_protein n=1 Tax=Hexamita inflata TaxID=28002 RepID=A0AA86RPX5_9EUKA|nr:Hypothetical protein HINF_LOCUS65123 [Hexamita inflata]
MNTKAPQSTTQNPFSDYLVQFLDRILQNVELSETACKAYLHYFTSFQLPRPTLPCHNLSNRFVPHSSFRVVSDGKTEIVPTLKIRIFCCVIAEQHILQFNHSFCIRQIRLQSKHFKTEYHQTALIRRCLINFRMCKCTSK